jgi:transposase
LEKQCEIDRLKEEIKSLRQKLNLNQRKIKQGFFGSSTPSAKVPVKANSLAENQAKKGGGKVGHRGVGRQGFPPAEADEQRTAQVTQESCETCQCRLQRLSANERDSYELERERARKIHYRIERKICPQCRKTVSAKVANALPRASLSNALIVEIAEQHYLLGRTLGQIAERFELPDATVTASLQRVGKLLQPCLAQLQALYRAAVVRHADETGWRTDGANGWSWYFGSAEVSLHLFRQTRGLSVVREVLGVEQLEGVLVVDRYASYHRVPCRIQYCYAHLWREMNDLGREFESNVEVQQYTQALKLRLGDAMQLRRRDLSEALYRQEAERIKGEILSLSEYSVTHPGVRKWQDFFVEKAERLYQWCESALIPAENNYAEREIRKVVIARKMSFGSQSEEGAQTREIWTSVLQSLKKREAQPRDKLVSALNELSVNENYDLVAVLFGSGQS